MIKIMIPKPSETDVTKMEVRGWTIKISHDNGKRSDTVFAMKGDIRFKLIAERGSSEAVLEKWVGSKLIDSKKTTTMGDGIVGTLFINDHSVNEKCYAYFRTRKIVEFMEKFDIFRVTFIEPTSGIYMPEYIVDDNGDGCPFKTDGNFSRDVEGGYKPIYKIWGARYILNKKDRSISITSRLTQEILEEIGEELSES